MVQLRVLVPGAIESASCGGSWDYWFLIQLRVPLVGAVVGINLRAQSRVLAFCAIENIGILVQLRVRVPGTIKSVGTGCDVER